MDAYVVPIGLSIVIGFALGALYFASLWRSVRAMPRANRPMRDFAFGAALRLVAVLLVVGLFLYSGVAPIFVLVGGVGFFAARLLATALGQGSKLPAGREQEPREHQP